MGTFVAYILKSAVCLFLFAMGYRLLLSRDTFYRFNRFVLLSGWALAALLPLCQVSVPHPSPLGKAMFNMEELSPLSTVVEEPGSIAPDHWPYTVGLWIYLVGLLLVAGHFLWSVLNLLWLLRHGKRERLADGCWLVVHSLPLAPFSWMGHIVLAEDDLRERPELILAHERTHIRLGHSWDLLLTEFCLWLQWFNPAAWMLRRALRALHEYEVDDALLRQGVDAEDYQKLLIQKAVGASRYVMANSLRQSPLIQRIRMMSKKRSCSWARMKSVFLLPLAALSVVLFARPEIAQQVDELSKAPLGELVVRGYATPQPASNPGESLAASNEQPHVSTSEKSADSGIDEPVNRMVAMMPEFPGGHEELLKFLGERIKYPLDAQRRGAEGRVQLTFVVEKDGRLTNIAVLRSVDAVLDAEAIRVATSMPRWIPGRDERGQTVRARYTIPVIFYLP